LAKYMNCGACSHPSAMCVPVAAALSCRRLPAGREAMAASVRARRTLR
jgi:hypothetical protein